MKTTIELPEDIHRAVLKRAERDGRPLMEELVQLVRIGLVSAGASVAEVEALAHSKASGEHVEAASGKATPASITVDPSTGLPLIKSPQGAPIHSMTITDALALEQQADSESDLERAGLPVRH